MTISSNIKIKDGIKFLQDTAKQIPFITARAINETAKLAQKKQIDHMEDVFIIRRPRFLKFSVKIRPFANKRKLKAVVSIDPPGGQKNDIYSKFEEGGTFTGFQGGRLAIPTSDVRPNIRKVIPRSKRPRALRQRGKTFILELRSGKEFIAKATGRGQGRDLQFLYLLVDEVPIQPDLQFIKTITGTVFNNYENEWEKAFNKVLG